VEFLTAGNITMAVFAAVFEMLPTNIRPELICESVAGLYVWLKLKVAMRTISTCC